VGASGVCAPHVDGAPHGLCKDTTEHEPYVRTPAETMEALSSLTKQQSAKAVYNNLTAELEVDAAPRNAAVVHDRKYREAKQQRKNNGTEHCKTFGDEFQCVFNMAQSDKALAEPFVRYVVATGERVPSVILYTERQIRELKAFCFSGSSGSVLLFDKTFNLGAIYVTVAVYKNLAVVRRKTNDHPIFIGPLYLHGHSDAETYSFFFSHVSSRLLDCPFSQLTIGADEEQAMRKAMTHAFHGALQVTCTQHLQSNGDKKLDSVVGSRSDVRRKVHNALFGNDGLTSCDDVIAFDDKVRRIRSEVLSDCPAPIAQHFDSCLHNLLRDNVVAGRPGWTNNNCESINHVIKQYTQWRPQQLPDLINKLRELVRGQYIEADRAICGRGDLQLLPAYAKHRTTVDMWKSMSAAQRQKASDACFRQTVVVPSSTSTDGTVTVATTPGAGKKPHQRKRHTHLIPAREVGYCRVLSITRAGKTYVCQKRNCSFFAFKFVASFFTTPLDIPEHY